MPDILFRPVRVAQNRRTVAWPAWLLDTRLWLATGWCYWSRETRAFDSSINDGLLTSVWHGSAIIQGVPETNRASLMRRRYSLYDRESQSHVVFSCTITQTWLTSWPTCIYVLLLSLITVSAVLWPPMISLQSCHVCLPQRTIHLLICPAKRPQKQYKSNISISQIKINLASYKSIQIRFSFCIRIG